MRKDDLVGRIIGILVFLGGVGLLVFVFSNAYAWFNDPNAGLVTTPSQTPAGSVTVQLGQSAIALLVRIALLIVMTIVGSMLAGRGAQLYFASIHRRPPAIAPNEELSAE